MIYHAAAEKASYPKHHIRASQVVNAKKDSAVKLSKTPLKRCLDDYKKVTTHRQAPE